MAALWQRPPCVRNRWVWGNSISLQSTNGCVPPRSGYDGWRTRCEPVWVSSNRRSDSGCGWWMPRRSPNLGALERTGGCTTVGGSEKGYHFGGDGGDWSPAFQLEPFPLNRKACSERPGVRQGRAVVGRGEANP